MLAIIVKILSVLGILLLCLAGLLLTAVLLVLFVPVTYRIEGRKEPSATELKVKVRWLLGLVRVDYRYPQPGRIVAKLLWFTMYDSVRQADRADPDKKPSGKAKSEKQKKQTHRKRKVKSDENVVKNCEDYPEEEWNFEHLSAQPEDNGQEKLMKQAEPKKMVSDGRTQAVDHTASEEEQKNREKALRQEMDENSSESTAEGIFDRLIQLITSKIYKIKYTIGKICDRIKNISEQQDYYRELLLHEETKLLFGHSVLRFHRIFKGIRPRRVSASITFGTGSPDTTGYALGIYSMLYPVLGQNINITPDFDKAVLEGKFMAAGHIMSAVLFYHGLRLLLDKRLRLFLRKMKREEA